MCFTCTTTASLDEGTLKQFAIAKSLLHEFMPVIFHYFRGIKMVRLGEGVETIKLLDLRNATGISRWLRYRSARDYFYIRFPRPLAVGRLPRGSSRRTYGLGSAYGRNHASRSPKCQCGPAQVLTPIKERRPTCRRV